MHAAVIEWNCFAEILMSDSLKVSGWRRTLLEFAVPAQPVGGNLFCNV
jgi:hypothetical protein